MDRYLTGKEESSYKQKVHFIDCKIIALWICFFGGGFVFANLISILPTHCKQNKAGGRNFFHLCIPSTECADWNTIGTQ